MSLEEVEAEPLLSPDAHMIPEDDLVIIPDEVDDNESIIGMWPAQNQNPEVAAVPNQYPGVPAAIVSPTTTTALNPMTGVVLPNVGGFLSREGENRCSKYIGQTTETTTD